MSNNISEIVSAAYKIEAAAKAIYIGAQESDDTAPLDLNQGDAISMADLIVNLSKKQVELLDDIPSTVASVVDTPPDRKMSSLLGDISQLASALDYSMDTLMDEEDLSKLVSQIVIAKQSIAKIGWISEKLNHDLFDRPMCVRGDAEAWSSSCQ